MADIYDFKLFKCDAPEGYAETMECLNKPKDWDVPGLIDDIAERLRDGGEVPNGLALAVIDKLMFGMTFIAKKIAHEHAERIDASTIKEAANMAKMFVASKAIQNEQKPRKISVGANEEEVKS